MYALEKRLTQWGSKELGDQGYTPIEILRYFYGSDMYINTAEEISGIPSSWPGYTLENGASGAKVRQLQEQLNVIAGAYPALPKIQTDGVYDRQLRRRSESFRRFLVCRRQEPWITGPGIRFHKFMWEFPESQN